MMDYAGRVAQADTYPKLLRLNAREFGDEIALREKDLGLWKPFTWNDYQSRVRDFALGMVELGLKRGDVIGIIGDNRPDWVSAEIATHAIGALSLGLYRDVLDEEAAYLLNYGEAKLVFAEDEEQVDKLLGLADRAPSLKHIVYSDARGLRKYDDPRLMSADQLAAMGRARAVREADLYDALVDATRGEDVAILCTTSGTTSHPKLAMLAPGRVLRHCAIYLAFEHAGFSPWMDSKKLLPGQNWARALEAAIETSDFCVPCFSSRSVARRGGFQAEIRYALDCARRVPLDEIFLVPVRLDACRVPRSIQREWQYVDLFPDWACGVARVVSAIRAEWELRRDRRFTAR